MMTLKSVCVSLISSRLGLEYSNRLWKHIVEGVEAFNVVLEGVLTPETTDKALDCWLRVAIVGTGGTEHGVLELAKRSKHLILVAHRHYNSLPAAIEAASALKNTSSFLGLKPLLSVKDTVEYVGRVVRVASAVSKLRRSRLGVVGGPSSWLVYSRVDSSVLAEKLGATLVEIPVEELIEAYKRVEHVEDERALLKSARRALVPPERVREALRLHEAVKQIISRYRLDAITIRCFDLISLIDVTACVSMALLNTQGFPAACEGDIPLLVSMALGEWVTGKPSFMGNVAFIEGEDLYIVHCTSALVGPFELHTHFESGRGVGVRVDYPVGEQVTVYRVDAELERLRVGVGILEPLEWSEHWCRTQVRIRGLKDPWRVVEDPIGNHYALILGNHAEDLKLATRLLGLKVEEF
jgi:L-fucose isomerase-like protein